MSDAPMSDGRLADGSPAESHPLTHEVLKLFDQRGGSLYGGEAVTQLQHALQAAHFAEQDGAAPALICAALLHDVGHLLHSLPDDAPDQGVDDRHEELAARWLAKRFPASVSEPVRMHVAAKRYLTAVEPEYAALLSAPSQLSLKLQGGPMSDDEVSKFESSPHYWPAVQLRRWDDAAKDPSMATADLAHFANYLNEVLHSREVGDAK